MQESENRNPEIIYWVVVLGYAKFTFKTQNTKNKSKKKNQELFKWVRGHPEVGSLLSHFLKISRGKLPIKKKSKYQEKINNQKKKKIKYKNEKKENQ